MRHVMKCKISPRLGHDWWWWQMTKWKMIKNHGQSIKVLRFRKCGAVPLQKVFQAKRGLVNNYYLLSSNIYKICETKNFLKEFIAEIIFEERTYWRPMWAEIWWIELRFHFVVGKHGVRRWLTRGGKVDVGEKRTKFMRLLIMSDGSIFGLLAIAWKTSLGFPHNIWNKDWWTRWWWSSVAILEEKISKRFGAESMPRAWG